MTNEQMEKMLPELKQQYTHLDMLDDAKQKARALMVQAAQAAMQSGALPQNELPDFVVEVPADATHGDLAINLAMVSARVFGMAPRKIAEALTEALPALEDTLFDKVEIAGPGFINLFLSAQYYNNVVMGANLCGAEYGRTNYGKGEKINVEFVSANPTGPMHLGNARGGAMGDCLAEALNWAGFEATREFYINDAGNQIVKFGRSLAARYLQIIKGEDAVEFPEDGYQGEDIKQRALEFYEEHGESAASLPEEEIERLLVEYALPKNVASLKADLEKYRVFYDVWFSESTLHQSGAVDAAIAKLTERGATYTDEEGTIWYKATEFGGEKDEVLVRGNGIPTYFAADIAYHVNKFERGFGRAINAWGADHHGHVARMKGVLDAIGLDGSKLDIVLFQFVQLVQDGQPVRMSKRTGKAITLTELLDEVPIDSARFFFNMREPGSQIEFDLDLAIKTDSDNPVYYVQYAHARISSILRALEAEGTAFNMPLAFANLDKLAASEERALIRHIAAFPGEIIRVAKSYDPAILTRYAVELATLFHKFYTACHVKGEEETLLQARLALCLAAKTALANALGMLKVTVPNSM